MIIAFVGHSFVPLADRTKEMVKEQIRESITNEKTSLFILADTAILTKFAPSLARN